MFALAVALGSLAVGAAYERLAVRSRRSGPDTPTADTPPGRVPIS